MPYIKKNNKLQKSTWDEAISILVEKIKTNETTALKLQGAIETLEYFNPQEVQTASHPPDEVDEVDAE